MSAAAFGVASFAFAEEAAVVTSNEIAVEQEHAAYEGFYFGLGVMTRATGEKVDYHGAVGAADDYNESNSSPMCLGGTIVAGFGKKMKTNQAYAGIEAGLDFSPNSYSANADKYTADLACANVVTYNLYTKRNGLIPSVAVRFGLVDCNTKILTYAKAGISYAKSTETYQQWAIALAQAALDTPPATFKNSGITPILALGLEKSFAKKMTCRVEAEYKFGKNKSKIFTNALTGDAGSSKQLRQKDAITLRAMVCYNVKI